MKRCGELGGTNAKNSSVEGELHGGGDWKEQMQKIPPSSLEGELQ